MNDEQFSELIESLNGIATRLEAVETAVLEASSAYNLKDVCDRLSEIENAASDISHKTPEYCAYTLRDVVEALHEVERAVS